jgi:hypothetical protein
MPLPFETPVLSWLGPWHFETFAGQMDDPDRTVPDPWLWGMRWVVQPSESLELGVNRVLMLGGKGVDLGLDDVANAFVNDAGQTDYNQLAGWDIKWRTTWRENGMALYGQWVGERDSGWGKWMRLTGVEWYPAERMFNGWMPLVWMEYSDTLCASTRNQIYPGVAYNHPVYSEGYRYRGRGLGSAFESDASVYSLGIMWHARRGRFWNTRIFSAELNRYNDPLNTLVTQAARVNGVSVAYEWPLMRGRAAIELSAQSDQVEKSASLSRKRTVAFRWSTR